VPTPRWWRALGGTSASDGPPMPPAGSHAGRPPASPEPPTP